MVGQKQNVKMSKETKSKKRGHGHLLANCVWLSGRLHIEGRLHEGPRIEMKAKIRKRKQNRRKKTRKAREKQYDIGFREMHDVFLLPGEITLVFGSIYLAVEP